MSFASKHSLATHQLENVAEVRLTRSKPAGCDLLLDGLHQDTLQFWSDLVREARSRRAAGEALDDSEVQKAISGLATVLAQASSRRASAMS